jgi:hypothetical protein
MISNIVEKRYQDRNVSSHEAARGAKIRILYITHLLSKVQTASVRDEAEGEKRRCGPTEFAGCRRHRQQHTVARLLRLKVTTGESIWFNRAALSLYFGSTVQRFLYILITIWVGSNQPKPRQSVFLFSCRKATQKNVWAS